MYLNKKGSWVRGPYVYFISVGDFVKIGTTLGDLMRRLDNIQASNPKQAFLLAAIPGGEEVEVQWHVKFEKLWVRGEWFKYAEPLKSALYELVNSDRSLVIHHRQKGTSPKPSLMKARRDRALTRFGQKSQESPHNFSDEIA